MLVNRSINGHNSRLIDRYRPAVEGLRPMIERPFKLARVAPAPVSGVSGI